MKKILSIFIILFLAFSLSACRKNTEAEWQKEIYGVPETGTVLDITEKNDQTIIVMPGDILYLKLKGESDSGKQWSVTSPTTGNFLMLKDHKTIGLNDPQILGGEFTDEWWLKIESKGEFYLQFDYGVVAKEAEKSFKLKVISQ